MSLKATSSTPLGDCSINDLHDIIGGLQEASEVLVQELEVIGRNKTIPDMVDVHNLTSEYQR